MSWVFVAVNSFLVSLLLYIFFYIKKININKRYSFQYRSKSYDEETSFEVKTIDNKEVHVYNLGLSDLVDKYILVFRKRRRYLTFKYFEAMNNVSIRVFAYNKDQKLITAFDFHELINSNYSSQIKMPSKTEFVNILKINNNIFQKKKAKLYRDYKQLILIQTLAFLFSLFPVLYLTIRIFTITRLSFFLKSNIALIIFIAVLLAIINYYVLNKKFDKTYSIELGVDNK